MKYLLIIIMLLIPTLAISETIVRDRTGSVAYTKQRIGNEIIYRDRSGSVIGTERIYPDQRDRPRPRVAPLAPLQD